MSMNRYIKYDDGKTLRYMFGVTRKELEKDIIGLHENGHKNIQVIKVTITKCTCKCGDVHEIYHDNIDKNFTEFIDSIKEK